MFCCLHGWLAGSGFLLAAVLAFCLFETVLTTLWRTIHAITFTIERYSDRPVLVQGLEIAELNVEQADAKSENNRIKQNIFHGKRNCL
ncbi:hypothetical protein [Endozoicomonas sp. ALE010]|uniref:hypothetical protein n=1 Tax=Endozoicomonas sp. ALE010 TaxID=3403081 RepID=UPI003BB5DC83